LILDFFVQVFFARQYRFPEIAAVNAGDAQQLDAGAVSAAAEQQTAILYAVAAGGTDQSVDPFRLRRGNSELHSGPPLQKDMLPPRRSVGAVFFLLI
jgi:hypothetical protein